MNALERHDGPPEEMRVSVERNGNGTAESIHEFLLDEGYRCKFVPVARPSLRGSYQDESRWDCVEGGVDLCGWVWKVSVRSAFPSGELRGVTVERIFHTEAWKVTYVDPVTLPRP